MINSFILSLFVSVLSLAACSVTRNGSAPVYDSNQPVTIATPESDLIDERKNPELINPEGWHIPVPPKAKKGPSEKIVLTTVDGKKVTVVQTTFVSLGEYQFARGAADKEQQDYLGRGQLRLVSIKERRVEAHIFSYVILARRINHSGGDSGRSAREHHFFYKIEDKDGDGKFESLFPGDSDNLVPRWAASKNKKDLEPGL
jgi:hypothetical protein